METNYSPKGGEANPSAEDVEAEEERAIVNDLLRELKLNYDYFETADISKYSAQGF
jgi:hypothetical protein